MGIVSMGLLCSVFVDEDHIKPLTLYWLPKLHKISYKSRFIANSFMCFYCVVYTFDLLPHFD